MRGRFWGSCALLIVLGVATAAAKGSGGRMGGSSWGKPSSSSSSSRSSSSSSSSSSWSSHPTTTTTTTTYSSPSHTYTPSYTPSVGYTTTTPVSYPPSDPSPYTSYSTSNDNSASGFIIFLIVVVAIIVIAALYFAIRRSGGGSSYIPYVPAAPVDAIDVSVLRIALDGRARKFVQTELARIANVADTATEDGRLAMLREVTLLLRRVRDAWVYGGAVNEPMRSMDAAKAVFDGHVDDARERFTNETISNVQGQKTGARSDDYTPHADEGEGVILVSIIVAARSELFTVAHIGNGEDLRKALEAASHRSAEDLVAIEIVWMPSEAGDRMSSVELEAKYPSPDLIKIAGALVGKTFCDYCGGPFPAELVSCPHCGAPTAGHPHAEAKAA